MTCFSWQICKILGQFTVQQGGVLINGQWVIDLLLNRFAAFFSPKPRVYEERKREAEDWHCQKWL